MSADVVMLDLSVDISNIDRPDLTSVQCELYDHKQECVTKRQYRFPVAIIMIFM